MKFQVHKCTSSCQRLVVGSKQRHSIICRYGFPKSVQTETTLNSLESVMRSKARGNKPIKLYSLERTIEEIYINDYNEEMLLLWDGNVDIQFVGEGSYSLNKYITDYMTKAEKNYTEAIWEECNKNKTLNGALKSYALKSFKSREIGVYEVAAKLLGYSYYEFSDEIKWLNTLPKDQRTRRLKEVKEIEKLDGDNTDIYHTNLLDNYYPNRPDLLENLSLYDLFSWYDFRSKQCNHNECTELVIKNQFGFFHKRNKPRVIKTSTIKPADKDSIEKYFFQLLFLFKPWRDEIKDLKGNFHNYQEAFHHHNETNSIETSLMTEFKDQKKRIDQAQKFSTELLKKAKLDLQASQENQNESQQLPDNQYFKKLLDLGVNDCINESDINPADLEESIKKLNIEQKTIYDEIIQIIDHQNLHVNKQCHCAQKPIRMFCSGVAGSSIFLFNLMIVFQSNCIFYRNW